MLVELLSKRIDGLILSCKKPGWVVKGETES